MLKRRHRYIEKGEILQRVKVEANLLESVIRGQLMRIADQARDARSHACVGVKARPRFVYFWERGAGEEKVVAVVEVGWRGEVLGVSEPAVPAEVGVFVLKGAGECEESGV